MKVISSSCCGHLIRREFTSVELLPVMMICVGRCWVSEAFGGDHS